MPDNAINIYEIVVVFDDVYSFIKHLSKEVNNGQILV